MSKEIAETILEIKSFYKIMDDHVFNHYMSGSNSPINISSNIYLSISETLDSMSLILKEENISDTYMLLRKFLDLICLDLYLNLYSKTEINLDNIFDNNISNWIKGEDTTKGFKFANTYIINHYPHKKIKEHFYPNGVYRNTRIAEIKAKTNYSTHFINISYFFTDSKRQKLNSEGFLSDLKYIFKYHISLLITIAESYFASTDYIDFLEIDKLPPHGSQYWVPEFIQNILKHYIYQDNAILYKDIQELVSLDLKTY